VALLAAWTLRVIGWDAVIVGLLRLAVIPGGAFTDNETLLVNPIRAVMLIVDGCVEPWGMLRLAGLAARLKSGPVTLTVIEVSLNEELVSPCPVIATR